MANTPLDIHNVHSHANSRQRDSNIELLRIVAMLFIVLEHLLIDGTHFFAIAHSKEKVIANALIAFLYIGVNCFILITGYYGTSFHWKRLLKFYLVCCFIEFVGFMLHYIVGDISLSRSVIANIIFPLSHSNTWFVRCYVVFLFIVPIINRGIDGLTQKSFLSILALMTFIYLYFGWFWKIQNHNYGYTVAQFVYLYIVGQYIHRFVNFDKLVRKRWLFVGGYVLCSIVWGVCANISEITPIPHWNGWAYNNPIVLCSAICFFMFFVTMNFYSKWINIFAKGTFVVFLVHMNRYIGPDIWELCFKIGNKYVDSPYAIVAILFILSLGILLGICILDIPRQKIEEYIFESKTSRSK